MPSAVKGFLQLQWKPLYQTFRYRKINVQHPRHPSFQRETVQVLVKPILPEVKRPEYETCEVATYKKQPYETPYPYLLGQEALNYHRKHRLVAFYHKGSIDEFQLIDVKVALKLEKFIVKEFKRVAIEEGFPGSEFEVLMDLYDAPTLTAFSEEPNLNGLLSVSKKMSTVSLLAAILDGELLSYSQLQLYNKLKDITAVRSTLFGILCAAQQRLVQSLSQHQSTLVQHLGQHIEINKKEQKDETS